MSTTAETPRHPVVELLARYSAIFAAVWAVRHELAGPRRHADETAFLPAALSLQETPVHPAPRRVACSSVSSTVLGGSHGEPLLSCVTLLSLTKNSISKGPGNQW